jgi:hypothetical protein
MDVAVHGVELQRELLASDDVRPSGIAWRIADGDGAPSSALDSARYGMARSTPSCSTDAFSSSAAKLSGEGLPRDHAVPRTELGAS